MVSYKHVSIPLADIFFAMCIVRIFFQLASYIWISIKLKVLQALSRCTFKGMLNFSIKRKERKKEKGIIWHICIMNQAGKPSNAREHEQV